MLRVLPLSKPYHYRDGPLVDGVRSRLTYTIAEMSDIPAVPTVPSPANAVPVADNESDVALRTGLVGSSTDYAREDHNHPVRRQVAPARPTLTFTGTAGSSMPQVTNLDTWTDEESVEFAWRCRCDLDALTGWNYITVPNIAGFQRPKITVEGTYRNTGNPSPTQPRAPYMGNEANHWSSTQRVYIGQYNQKTGTGRYYVSLTVKYVRV